MATAAKKVATKAAKKATTKRVALVHQDVVDSPVVVREAQPVQEVSQPAAMSPVEAMRQMSIAGVDTTKMKEILEMQIQWQREEARKAFNEALSAVRAEGVRIIKNQMASFDIKNRNTGEKTGTMSYRYSDLANVVATISPVLAKHGLGYRWETSQDERGLVSVTCILSHRMGHSERTTLTAPVDNTGNKNSIQAIGSTVTYLERYTLKAIVGISEDGDDTDGRAPLSPQVQKDVDSFMADLDSVASAVDLDNLFNDAQLYYKKQNRIDLWMEFVNKYRTVKQQFEQQTQE